MYIENWFCTPILCYDLEKEILQEVQFQIEKVIPIIMKKDLSNPWSDNTQTSFKYVDFDICDIHEYSLNKLNQVIIEASEKIFTERKLRIFQSWFNFSYKNNFQFDHRHVGEKSGPLSGVYYYKTNGEDGEIEFSTPVNFFPTFHGRVVRYKPKIGRLLLFPSWLLHKVHINKTDNLRISISFNLR